MQDCAQEVETGNRQMGTIVIQEKHYEDLTGKVGMKKGEVQMGFKRENQQDSLTN